MAKKNVNQLQSLSLIGLILYFNLLSKKDGRKPYLNAVHNAFGFKIDYAMLIKYMVRQQVLINGPQV